MSVVDAVRSPAPSTRHRHRRSRPSRPAPWQHQPSLDGLRALAVGAVLLFHGGYLEGGFLGVDLFFALSGFLITSLLVRDANGTGIDLLAFWGRRFRRLLPALFTMLAAVALWTWAWGSPAELDGVRRDGPWALGYLANWQAIAQSGGYWQSFSQPSMFDHLWSLAIEEQFYVLWPLALAAVWRWAPRPNRALATLCGVGIVGSLTATLLLATPGDPTRVYMGTDTRAASLLVGALAATGPVRRTVAQLVGRAGARATSIVAVLIGCVVLWSWAAVDGASSTMLYRGGLAAHSALCAALVVTVTTAPHTSVARVLGWRPLQAVGVLSYGLYLWHWPVYVVLSPQRTGLDGVALLVVRVACSALFAAVSYRLVEDPIRRRAAWARGPAAAPALAGSVLAVAVVLAALPAPGREIATFDPSSVRAAASPAPTSAAPADVTASTAPATDPATTVLPATPAPAAASTEEPAPPAGSAVPAEAAGSRPAVTAGAGAEAAAPAPPSTLPPRLAAIRGAVWAGDSIAWDMAPGVEAALDAAGVPVDVGAASVGMRLVQPDEYTDLLRAVSTRLADGADTVILQLSIWDAAAGRDQQAAVLQALHDQVVAHDARLVLVRPPAVGDAATNEGAAAMFVAAQAIAAADPGRVLALDPSAMWGPAAAPDLDGDGTPERKPDLTHVCPSGSARFGAWLAGELAARFDGVAPAPPETWAADDWVIDDRYDQPTGACAPVG